MMLFNVLVVSGSFLDVSNVETDALRYEGLSFGEAVELCRLSFSQGFQCVIWRVDDKG